MDIYQLLLGTHIAGGFTALGVGAFNIITKKGTTTHQGTGRIFFWSMLIVSFSALAMCLLKQNAFLLHIALFTLYMNVAGYRSVQHKSLHPQLLDIALLLLAIGNAAIMLWKANIILVVFASITLSLAFNDLRIYYMLYQQLTLPKMAWLRRHIGMILGTYLSTFTAFLVVNIQLPTHNWIVWLLPTFLITPLIIYWTRKIGKSTRIALSLFLFISFTASLDAQIYVEKQTRHRFAQISLGIDHQISLGGQSSFLNQANQLESLDLKSLSKQRIIIGGTHFWGHADFYVAVPVRSQFYQTEEQNLFYGTGVETIFKYYPWRIEHNKIRPFIGTGIVPVKMRQNSRIREDLARGASASSAQFPLLTGFTYDFKNHLLEATLMYDYNSRKDLYVSPTQQASVSTPPLYLSFAYRFMFDTTIGSEKNWESGHTQALTKRLGAKGKLNNFFIGLAPSTSSGVRKAGYNITQRPFFNAYSSNIFADWTLGYHFHNADMNIALNMRNFRGGHSSFGISQSTNRRSIGLEWTKGLGDYHGFTPFIGPSLTYEQLKFREWVDGELMLEKEENKPGLGIVFGWDIRPNRVQWFVLRTNLRYYPNLNLTLDSGDKIAFDNIEFNFIQLILYPGRMF